MNKATPRFPHPPVSETSRELRNADTAAYCDPPFEPETNPGRWILTFGKFKGRDLADVASTFGGPGYLGYLHFNVHGDRYADDLAAIGAFLHQRWSQMEGGSR